MTSDEIIDRAARTLASELGYEWDGLPETRPPEFPVRWLSWSNLSSEGFRELARLVILPAFAAERERICLALPGGYSCDPQEIADMIRGMGETT